jgi:hypothetical protein
MTGRRGAALTLMLSSALAAGLALATGQAAAQDADQDGAQIGAHFAAGQEKTIPRNQLWRPLYPDRPGDPNSPVSTGDSSAGVSEENPWSRSYHWAYARTDPTSGMPLQIPEGDPRNTEIDDFRVQCIKLINGYMDDNHIPDRIPVSKFKNLQDQAAEGVVACVNHIYLRRDRWWRGVGAIVCEVNTDHCWGPRDVWRKFGPQGATAGR